MKRSWTDGHPRGKIVLGGLILLLLIALALGAVVLGRMSAVRHSGVFQEALARASADPKVVAELGEPIRTGYYVSGKLQTRGRFGFADFDVALIGPRNDGVLSVLAYKIRGEWQYRLLEVDVEGSPSIDLLPAGNGK
ncbi:MAG TPA: cytochrome c oxidase assembly factor Coa1 family protein [Terriglobales bacterium]